MDSVGREAGLRLVESGRGRFAEARGLEPFTKNDEADRLLNDLDGHPHAFVLACIMDRQIPAERAWLIPFEIQQRLGSFAFETLRPLSAAETLRLFTQPKPLHRFNETMAELFRSAIQRMQVSYEGDARRIWTNRPSSATVVLRFLEFDGVGQKIATMAANLLARIFKVEMSDYYSIDVSVDVQVRRVLERLRVVRVGASPEEVIYAARSLNPEYPGILDAPAWELGRSICHPRDPDCPGCYMKSYCPSAQGKDVRG